MISGIHLATALSVMLHMEQEGSGMDKVNKTEELSERLKYVADILNTHSEKLPVPPHIRLHATKAREAADLLSEQQKVIDELVEALSNLETRASSYISAHGQMTEAFKDGMNVHGALSVFVGAEDMYESAIVDARNAVAHAKGYTKDAD